MLKGPWRCVKSTLSAETILLVIYWAFDSVIFEAIEVI